LIVKILLRLYSILEKLKKENDIYLRRKLLSRLPTNGLTPKNIKYFKMKLKGALSHVMRTFRRLRDLLIEKIFINTSFLKYLLRDH